MESKRRLGLIVASVGANLFLLGIYLMGRYDHVRPKEYIVAKNHSVATSRSFDMEEAASRVGKVVNRGEGDVFSVLLSDEEFEKLAVRPELIVEPIVRYSKPKPLTSWFGGCSRPPAPAPEPDPDQPSQEIDWGVMRSYGPDVQEFVIASAQRVCVLDTGVDMKHPDLLVEKGRNFTTAMYGDFQDRDGHGTHTAGLVAALNNSIGVLGASNATLMIGKVLGDDGSGQNDWIAQGIYWCADNGATVISMSLGGPYPSQVLQNAIVYATNKGIDVFAAAGNDGSTNVGFPAGFEISRLYSIAATDAQDRLAYFSNYGKVEFACPGVEILSTMPGGAYGTMSGTSMATPICAGIAALYRARGRSLSAEFLGEEFKFGAGILSAKSLLNDGF